MHEEQKDGSAFPPESTRQYPFSRQYRLTEKYQYDFVLTARAIQMRSGCLRAFAVSNRLRGARLGLIVGKRQLKRAVDRNRVKRALRESFRTARSTLPPVDVVIQLTAPPRNESLRTLADALWIRLAS